MTNCLDTKTYRITIWPENDVSHKTTREWTERYSALGNVSLLDHRSKACKAAVSAARSGGLDTYYDKIIEARVPGMGRRPHLRKPYTGKIRIIFARLGAPHHRSQPWRATLESKGHNNCWYSCIHPNKSFSK